MPPLTRWFLRAAMLDLLAAVTLGVLLAWPTRTAPGPLLAASWPVYIHLFVVGWLTQLVFGVAWWMFPRRERTPGRGTTAAGWSIFGLLNAGLLLRVMAEPRLGEREMWTQALVALSAIFQLLAAWLFVLMLWPRIRGR